MTVAALGDPGGGVWVQMRGESRDASTFTQIIHQPPLPGGSSCCSLPAAVSVCNRREQSKLVLNLMDSR